MSERIRCQHAELSDVRCRSPTHSSAIANRNFFWKTKTYRGDKGTFCLRDRERLASKVLIKGKRRKCRTSYLISALPRSYEKSKCMLRTLRFPAQGFRSSDGLSSDFNGGHRFFSYRGKGQEDHLKYLTDEEANESPGVLGMRQRL